MNKIFSQRISGVPKSFIREILKISLDPNIISFAGGLPNKKYFPTLELQKATEKVFNIYGNDCLQYSNSEGSLQLRQQIAERYQDKKNIDVKPENILITNGAQQGLDLLGKVLLNQGDGVIVEEPGYLGALQAFSIYQPEFLPFAVSEDGADLDIFKKNVDRENAKLIYLVPNFQNPSGLSYSLTDRTKICEAIEGRKVFLVEDDPYGELRFKGDDLPSFYSYLPQQTILLGSYSKTVIPGFRIGWIVAPDDIIDKILVAKQAADLHTCHFTQYILYQYLLENDIDLHIKKIVNAYGRQCTAMIEGLSESLPQSITFTQPDGGMFLWGNLPDGLDSMEFFNFAVKENVVFVPGAPFYVGGKTSSSFRLSFSCVDEDTIQKGIERFAKAVEKFLP